MSEAVNENISIEYIPMKKLKTSTIGVFIHTPLTRETASANAVLPYILSRGCRICPDTEKIEKYLEELYGADLRVGIIKKGTDQILYFGFEAISDKYAAGGEDIFAGLISLAMSVIFEPITENGGFVKAYFEQERKNALDRLESIKNDKRAYAQLRCQQELCGEEDVFSIPKFGTREGFETLDAKGLYEHYKKLISSSLTDIFVCGECDIESVKKTVREYAQRISFTKGSLPKTEIINKNTPVNYVEERMDVTQGKLSMGFVTDIEADSDDYFALMAANSVFGGGAHSKLFNNVREKLSLCYYASSGIERSKGIIMVNAGIEFKNYQAAYDEILVQLEDVKRGNISELEFESSIYAIVNSLKTCKDDQYAMQTFALTEKILGTYRTLDDIIEKIESVTKEDIVRVSQSIRLDTVYFLKGLSD